MLRKYTKYVSAGRSQAGVLAWAPGDLFTCAPPPAPSDLLAHRHHEVGGCGYDRLPDGSGGLLARLGHECPAQVKVQRV